MYSIHLIGPYYASDLGICEFPSPDVIVPNFIYIAPIVFFWGGTRQKLAVPTDSKGEQQLELY